MDGNILGLIELLGISAVVLFFAFRELWLLKKDREEREAKKAGKPQDKTDDA